MRVLDLFCGAGGASMGYHQAGFEVVGVDIKPQPYYPFEFIQDDAFSVFQTIGGRFDLIHASPPCQRWSLMTKRWGSNTHLDLITPLRELLIDTPYVIENVQGAPLIDPIKLCGSMFGLEVRRHRLFESNLHIDQPKCNHKAQGKLVGVYGNTGGTSKRDGITFGLVSDWKRAMGIDWMNSTGLREAIPPAYTKYIGELILSGENLRI